MSDEEQGSDNPNAFATMERAGMLNRQQRRALEAAARRAKKRNRQLAPAVRVTALASAGILVAAFMNDHLWMLLPALLFGLVSAGLAAVGMVEALFNDGFQGLATPTATGARIGMGANVQEGAVLEPGAIVEMGANVQSGAIVQGGAVVGMGATVESGAIIEANARVGWGATVRSGAVVRAGASIGAGSTVESGAVVEAGAHVGAGSTVAHRPRLEAGAAPATAQPLPARAPVAADPRDTRIDELCDRFEAELEHVTGEVDQFLRNPRETVTSVRRTCHDLLRRERELRREANPAEQERLNREAAALETRVAEETDDETRRQLQGAIAAIEEQRRQRLLLLRDANRLEAEQTRLVWTMEGLVAHMVRLRTTQGQSSRLDLDRGLSTLQDEVASISSALEQVQSAGLPDAPMAVEAESTSRGSTRERTR